MTRDDDDDDGGIDDDGEYRERYDENYRSLRRNLELMRHESNKNDEKE